MQLPCACPLPTLTVTSLVTNKNVTLDSVKEHLKNAFDTELSKKF